MHGSWLPHAAQRLRLGISSKEAERLRLRSTGLGCAHVAICAVAGTSWLLQFIEDMQQSRAFHRTCELELPKGQAAKIPEVCYAGILYCTAPTYILAVPRVHRAQRVYSSLTTRLGTVTVTAE
jgi:hypothetical protein